MPRTPRSRIYDGPFYARFIDPFVSGLHRIVVDRIEAGAKVLDVGCGTGNLLALVADSAKEVVGVELSPAMAEYATRRFEAKSDNVTILIGDVTEVFGGKPDNYFDVATMVLVLHEMPADWREPVLQEVTRVAARLVCLEYRVPMPWNFPGVRNRLAELAAGVEHFRAFRDFNRRGGAEAVARAAGLAYRNIRHPDSGSFDLSVITRV